MTEATHKNLSSSAVNTKVTKDDKQERSPQQWPCHILHILTWDPKYRYGAIGSDVPTSYSGVGRLFTCPGPGYSNGLMLVPSVPRSSAGTDILLGTV